MVITVVWVMRYTDLDVQLKRCMTYPPIALAIALNTKAKWPFYHAAEHGSCVA
jgi:hypothetical protein